MELTHPDFISTLFTKPDSYARIEVLAALVMDLFVEVEALREAVMRLESVSPDARSGSHLEHVHPALVLASVRTVYQKAYLETAFETYNISGPSGGLDKLLARF